MQASSRSPTRRPGTYLLVFIIRIYKVIMSFFRLLLFNNISRCLVYFIAKVIEMGQEFRQRKIWMCHLRMT